jgi:hypothetical protein
VSAGAQQRARPQHAAPAAIAVADPADALAIACARYAELILMQLEALGADDFLTFDACAEERDVVAGAIEALQPEVGDGTSLDAAALVAEQFARCDEADRLLVGRLAAMRAEAAAALDEHDARRPRVLAYGSAAPPTPGSVDVRL